MVARFFGLGYSSGRFAIAVALFICVVSFEAFGQQCLPVSNIRLKGDNVIHPSKGIHSFEWFSGLKEAFPTLHAQIVRSLENGSEAEAANRIDDFIQSSPQSIELLLSKAYLLSRGSSYYGAQAQRDFTLLNLGNRLIGLDSTRYEGYTIVGSVLNRLYAKYRYSRIEQRKEEALQNRDAAGYLLSIAAEKEPLNPCPHIAFISYLVEIGDYNVADVAAGSFREKLPQYPQPWLLRGLTKTLLGEYQAAEGQFNRALALLQPEEKSKFLDISDLMGEVNDETLAAWHMDDPRLLTNENERLVSHYARLVYSDLLFPLWRQYLYEDDYITPGDVIVRYGFPSVTQVTPSVLHQGSRIPEPKKLNVLIPRQYTFRFDDEFNSGDWVVPSEKVIEVHDIFRAQPNTPDPPTKQPFDIPFTVSFLKNDAAGVDVLVTTGVPVLSTIQNASFLDYTEGIFLRDENMSIVSRSILDERLPAERYKIQIDSFDVWTKTTIHETEEIPAEVVVEAETSLQVAALTTVPDHEIDFSKFSISSPVLSSLVEEHFGEGSKKAPLQRKGFDIYPLPVRLVPPSKQIYIYFEVYNLPLAEKQVSDAGFDLTVQLTKFSEPKGTAANIFGRLKDLILRPETTRVAVSISYSDNAKDQAKYVILDLDDYESGYYQLDLLVSDKSGRNTAKSSSEIWIR